MYIKAFQRIPLGKLVTLKRQYLDLCVVIVVLIIAGNFVLRRNNYCINNCHFTSTGIKRQFSNKVIYL